MYKCIVIDPPWNEPGGHERGANAHYTTLHTQFIPGVIKRSPKWLPDKDCHLWLWTTVAHLPDTFWVLDILGFEYKTHFVWVKDGRMGLGQYLRVRHELCLLATRGKAMVFQGTLQESVLSAKRGKHSEKPDEAYKLISWVSPGPRLEMFARKERSGWDVWGDQV